MEVGGEESVEGRQAGRGLAGPARGVMAVDRRSGCWKASPLLLSLFFPGHLSEDPRFPKVPWPTPDLCPACHEETKGLDSWDEGQVLLFLKRHYSGNNLDHTYAAALGGAGEGGGPAEAPEREGGRASPLKPGDQGSRSLRPPSVQPPRPGLSEGPHLRQDRAGVPGRREAEAATPFLGSGFSSLDMSLCVMLYVASSLFLMLMFFFFRVRSKRRTVRHRHPAV